MKKNIICFMSLMIIVISSLLKGCEADHNDGKCDVCNKPSNYSSLSDGELCDEHLGSAIDWYLNQD